MHLLKKVSLYIALTFLLLIGGLNLWGVLTLGTITPDAQATINYDANRVVMVFGATGSAGDGLLKAAIEDPLVEKVIVVTRRSSPRIELGIQSGKVEMKLLKDFTDYQQLRSQMAETNTVLWALGTSSLLVDEETYKKIHVDFPTAFVEQWLSAKSRRSVASDSINTKDSKPESEEINSTISGPMAFHFITGMGTDGDASWAIQKRRSEQILTKLGENNALRSFHYRSGFIRPTSEHASSLHRLAEWLSIPGDLVITGKALGQAMLEVSRRTDELPNGTILDNADSIAYAKLYKISRP